MSTYTDFLALSQRLFARHVGVPLIARASAASDTIVGLIAGANGGLAVEGVAGGTPVPVSGSVTATVDTSALATQATLAAVLAKLIAAPATAALQTAANALLAIPTLHTAITASDATDLTAVANVGVIVGGAGNLAYRLTGAPSTTVTLPVQAGQYVPGQFTRVMAATTATGIVGVAR